MMSFPLLLTNYKNYPAAVGAEAEMLTKIHVQVRKKSGKNFAVAVNPLDIRSLAEKFGDDILLFSQHVDAADYGATTGKIIPAEVKKAGAFGTLLNHSEHRFPDHETLGKAIELSRKAGLYVIVCAENTAEGEKIMNAFVPDLIAVEPPELIGGDISVSTARPELISESVEKIGAGKVLVGAGVKNGHDVKIAVELGASGVLLASGVAKSADPEKVLYDLISEL
jgi:triosephosphate isomerase